jgi:hypothetical protein
MFSDVRLCVWMSNNGLPMSDKRIVIVVRLASIQRVSLQARKKSADHDDSYLD